jgi:hypothetical protein
MPESADAKRRQRQIAAEIAKLGLCLPGSLVERTTRCGSPRCRSAGDPSQLHGPYPSRIRKVGTKTITRMLTPAQTQRYRPMFDNARHLRELISELQALSAQATSRPKDGHNHQIPPPGIPATAKTHLQITCPRRTPEAGGGYGEDAPIRG